MPPTAIAVPTEWAKPRTSSAAAAAVLCLGGRFDDAVPFATEGLALARTNGAPSTVTGNLIALAQALSQREPERARVLLEEAAHGDLRLRALRPARPTDRRRRHDPRLAPHRTLRDPQHPPRPLDQPPALSPRRPHHLRPRAGRHRPRSRRHDPRRRPHTHDHGPLPQPLRPVHHKQRRPANPRTVPTCS